MEGKNPQIDSEDNVEPEQEEQKQSSICQLWWKVVIVLLLAIAVIAVIASKQKNNPKKSVESGQVGETIEASATDEKENSFPTDTVLATVNGEKITLAGLESTLKEMPQQHRDSFKRNRHGLLDQLIVRKLLLQNAQPTDNLQHNDEELINGLLQREVLESIEVTDQDVKAFYERHKDKMPGGRSFDDLKGSLQAYALQEKQAEAIDLYLEKLQAEADISRNEEWIEAQKARAADNPLDRALEKDVPVVADFGRDSCVPCKMMKPILEDLKAEYEGRAEILIIKTDEYPAVTQRVGIRAIPTQIFYDADGNEIDRHQGFMSREAIIEKLKAMGVQ